jgi:hypothetical protein
MRKWFTLKNENNDLFAMKIAVQKPYTYTYSLLTVHYSFSSLIIALIILTNIG